MAYIDNQQQNTGSFVPTTNIWDVQALFNNDVNSAEFKELILRIYQNINLIALVLNTKKSAFFPDQEFVNGSLYALNPSVDPIGGWSKFIIIGALGAGVTSVAHGIPFTALYKMISIAGSATNTGTLDYYPLPYAGGGANDIQVRVDGTNVVVTNNSGVTFDYAYVILEYIKS